jgi:ribosomal protein L12E/L44/L45/RPP1/RPP2
VDLVADPATNMSLFEDKGGSSMAVKLKKKSKSRQRLMAEFLEGVSEHEELADLLEAAAAEPETASAPDTPLAATAKMAAAVFMDESMDIATKRKKIAKLLDLIDDSMQDAEAAAAEGEEEEVPEDTGEKPAGKLKKPAPKPKGKELAEDKTAERLAVLEKKDEIRTLCESKGFTPTPVQLKSLLAMDDEDERTELIESWGEKAGAAAPAASTLGPRAAAAGGAKPKSKPQGKDLAESKIEKADLQSLLV